MHVLRWNNLFLRECTVGILAEEALLFEGEAELTREGTDGVAVAFLRLLGGEMRETFSFEAGNREG